RDGVSGADPETFAVQMYGQDWPLPAGHRVAVLVSGANAEWWVHVPTQQTVEVAGGNVSLPFLRYRRTAALDGQATPRLRGFLSSAPFPVPPETIAAAQASFALP